MPSSAIHVHVPMISISFVVTTRRSSTCAPLVDAVRSYVTVVGRSNARWRIIVSEARTKITYTPDPIRIIGWALSLYIYIVRVRQIGIESRLNESNCPPCKSLASQVLCFIVRIV